MAQEFGHSAGGDDAAAVHAGARAEINDEVGAAHGLLVVLDHHEGVAAVAELVEAVEQAVVVAVVQPDGRLIEHVEHAAEV